MIILSIDSSGPVASAALLSEEKVLAEYNADYGMMHSATLMPAVKEITRRIGLSVNEIDAVAVTAGPGSFTGLRIGTATAKALAMAIDKPVIPVPTLSALAMNFCGSGDLICPIMDARRSQVYNALFRFNGTELVPLTEQRPIYVKDLISEVNALCASEDPVEILKVRQGEALQRKELPAARRVIFLGDGVPVYRAEIEAGLQVPYFFAPAHLCRQRAASAGVLALTMFAEGICESADTFTPIYLRKSQAEQEKERAAARAAAEAEAKVEATPEDDSNQIAVRVMTLEDLTEVCAIERENFPEDPWSEEGFAAHVLRDDTVYLVAEQDGKITGYAGVLNVAPEADITKVSTKKDLRRKGIGFTLLQELLRQEQERGIEKVYLEVRESNAPALGLYKKAGFTVTGLRKNYYSHPQENAVLMTYTC